MRFAFAGIDFLGDVFLTLLERGWTPVKLFTRPCDKVYDFNETVVGRARSLNIPIQLSRIRAADLASLPSLRCEALIVAGYPWLVTGWEAPALCAQHPPLASSGRARALSALPGHPERRDRMGHHGPQACAVVRHRRDRRAGALSGRA
jgi:methionyl-tRNA formyltransferase